MVKPGQDSFVMMSRRKNDQLQNGPHVNTLSMAPGTLPDSSRQAKGLSPKTSSKDKGGLQVKYTK